MPRSSGSRRTCAEIIPRATTRKAHYGVELAALREAVNERAALMFWLLMGAAAFVLLVACANVSNLTLMRGAEREREMVVRLALGAGHARLQTSAPR